METKIKALLLDVDGTLITSDSTHMLPSTVEALEKCRSKGIKLFLATGRQTSELRTCLGGFEFDAQVLLNGQYAKDKTGMFFDNPVPQDEVEAMVEQVEKEHISCQFVEGNDCYINCITENTELAVKVLNIDMPRVTDIHCAIGHRIYQFNPFITKEQEHLVTPAVPNCVLKRWHPNFCDIYPKNGGKIRGIQALMERFGLSLSDCMAFGDGENDYEMIKNAGIGVAMGNAGKLVKEVAAFVTDDNDHDGIAKALEHFILR